MSAARQRSDGSITWTSPEWDDRWYWPVGTRVEVQGQPGSVAKTHQTTVDVQLDSGTRLRRVRMAGLVRRGGLT